MSAGDAARFANGFAAVPKHAWMFVFPSDGKSLIYLDVLAGFNAPSAEDALARIVSVKRIGGIDLVRFLPERDALMLHVEKGRRVVDCTVAIVIVTDCAIEIVIRENVIESL